MRPNLLTDLFILVAIVLLARCGGDQPVPGPGPSPTPEKVVCTQIGSPALEGHAYSWSPTVGLSDPSVAQPMACPKKTTKYTVTAVTKCGKATSSMTLKVTKVVDGQLVEVTE